VLIRRAAPRALLAGLAVAVSVAGLAGCRTSPTVAAYVSDAQISVDRLDSAVAARKASDKALASYADAHSAAYPRQVLGLLVTQEVYAAVARREHVSVGNEQVRTRITQLLQGTDEAQAYAQLAQQGLSRTDVFENVRQQLVRQALGRASLTPDPLSEAALQASYAQNQQQFVAKTYGYIDLPDQATANAVLAQLIANPAGYPAIAAAHPGQLTQPTVTAHLTTDTPQALQPGIAAAAPNTGFTVAGPSGDVVLCFVGGPVTFASARAGLEQAAATTADTAGQKRVADVRKNLRITVNPRYGVLKSDGTLTDPAGVVKILGGSAAASASASGGS
jgi:ribosomal protein S11